MTKIQYNSVKEAVDDLKLDRRRKYDEFMGELITHGKDTIPCSWCCGSGCDECGYTGKEVIHFPIPILDKNGDIVRINPQSHD